MLLWLHMTTSPRVPVTVFTGYLGSGKTTIILNLIKQLPTDYKTVWLKNEFGDMAVDSLLAKEQSIAVQEMLNGCLCCVLVGKLGNALDDLLAQYRPDRIIIETSGSAYPAPIAWEILAKKDRLMLDGVITVIDALNFDGYKDKSITAKRQAEETDLILINKHELVASERVLEDTLDDVYELNPTTPKIKTNEGLVSPDVIFGLDSTLFDLQSGHTDRDTDHHHNEVEVVEFSADGALDAQAVLDALSQLPKDYVHRIKGVVYTAAGPQLLNIAFGRGQLVPLKQYDGQQTRLVVMGHELERYEEEVRGVISGQQPVTRN